MDLITYAMLKKLGGTSPGEVDVPTKLSDLEGDENHRVVTDVEKEEWNSKSDFSGSYNDLSDKPNSLPASDVYEWAKQSEKPTYTANEVGALSSDTNIVTEENVVDLISSNVPIIHINKKGQEISITDDVKEGVGSYIVNGYLMIGGKMIFNNEIMYIDKTGNRASFYLLQGDMFVMTYNGSVWTRSGTYSKIYSNDVLTKNGNIEYIPTNDYNPSTKKYVDDSLGNALSFDEDGNLVVTIGDVSKTFVPKVEE